MTAHKYGFQNITLFKTAFWTLVFSLSVHSVFSNAEELTHSGQRLKNARGPWTDPGFNYAHCANGSINGSTTPFDAEGTFRPECAPEVLYSWQNQEMISLYERQATAENILPVQRMFLWRTPLGSFGYGIAPLRIKLKPTTRFVDIPLSLRTQAFHSIGWYGEEARLKTCEFWKTRLSASGQVVFVSVQGDRTQSDTRRAHEYILCDSEAVESWSVVSPEILQEIQWELDQILGRTTETSLKGFQFDVLSRQLQEPWNYTFDSMNWSVSYLIQALNWMHQSLREGKHGIIHYAKDIPPSRERHFSVSRPNYYLRRPLLQNTVEPKLEPMKILSIRANRISHSGEVTNLPQANDRLSESCIGHPYCYWDFYNEVVSNRESSGGALSVEWNCETESEPRSIRFPFVDPLNLEGVSSDLLYNMAQLHCLLPSSQ